MSIRKREVNRWRPCPRCKGTMRFDILVVCRSLATGIAKCTQCGRSWGVKTFEIKDWYVDNRQKKHGLLKVMWPDKYDAILGVV